MSKTIERELTEIDCNELIDRELDTVTGGGSMSNAIGGVIKAIGQIAAAEGPPEVWVGCGWVPQWW